MEAGTFTMTIVDFSLGDLIYEVHSFFEDQCNQKDVDFKLNVSEQARDSMIISDRNRLRQVFLNLVSNAVKFTFRGSITISCWVSDDQQFLEFSVEDTGIGIKEEDQRKLFKMFGMVSDNNALNPNGSGIGLTFSQKMLEKLNGTIHLESEFGKGTKVSFKIPYRPRGNLPIQIRSNPQAQGSSEEIQTPILDNIYSSNCEFADKDLFANPVKKYICVNATSERTWK